MNKIIKLSSEEKVDEIIKNLTSLRCYGGIVSNVVQREDIYKTHKNVMIFHNNPIRILHELVKNEIYLFTLGELTEEDSGFTEDYNGYLFLIFEWDNRK